MSRAVYLRQKKTDQRIELDDEDLERILSNPQAAVVDHHANCPVVKLS
ncbi:hypothetical protein [Haloarcula litorea]|nr:hypothetical protein [Halomicroarcula sp. GDY20]